ncbi:MAG: (2Fe-2S)-binding protein [Pseudomonadota bacterium]
MTASELSRRDVLRSTRNAVTAVGATAIPVGTAVAQGAAFQGDANLQTSISINGAFTSMTHEARVSLLDLLREQLKLTGTKKGCNEGACGACTVLLDGQRVNACMTLAASCDGGEVITVEGLAAGDETLNAVQRAFIAQDAFQCGYCTPGQLVSAVACINEGHAGSEEEIAEWMSGNICRCAAYPQIVAAVQQAAEEMGA